MFKRILLISVAALALTACSKVPAGNVGVKVYLLGSDKGVDKEILGPGRHWIGINEELYLFPTFTQTYTFEGNQRISFQSNKGMTARTDVGVSYSINPDKVADIFQKYRKGVDEITSTVLRVVIQDAFTVEGSTRSIESVYGGGKAALIESVEKRVRNQVEPLGIRIERVYLIGELELPPAIVTKINESIEAQQKVQQIEFQVLQQTAEAKKIVEDAKGAAESIRLTSEAQAKANRILAESLTDELVRYKTIEKWNGELPKISGAGTDLLINPTDLISGKELAQ